MSATERFKQLLIEYPPSAGAPCPPALNAIPSLAVKVLSELIERVEKLEARHLLPPHAHTPPCHCENGWVCETHPDHGWPHEGCTGVGMPCQVCREDG